MDAGPSESGMTQSVLTAGGMVTLPATGFGDTGVTTAPVSAGWATGSVAWCCSNWWVPVGVSAGDVVGSVAALVQDVAPSPLYIPGSQGDGGSSVILSVVAQTGNTSTTLGTASSNGSGAQQSLIVTLASPYTVPPGTSVVLKAAAFALWPSSVMHSSIVGPVATAAPALATSAPLTEVYSVGFAVPGAGVQLSPGTASTNATLNLNTSTASSTLPLRTQAGRTLSAWSVRAIKNSTTGAITARLWRAVAGSGAAVQIGSTRTLSAQSVAPIGQSGLVELAPNNASYFIEVLGGGSAGDFIEDYQLTTQ